jgi:arylsulfatase A-like enzyme
MDVGFMGSEYYRTSNIDRLAREGMVFSDAYAAAPNCAPSRASLLTGQYTPRHGVFTVGSSERGKAEQRRIVPTPNRTTLAPEHVTIAEVLAEAGYATAMIGKWHLGDAPDHDPLSQGFQMNVAGNTSGHPDSYFSPYGNKDLTDGPAGEYLTDRLTDESLRFIEANQAGPFFLYLSHYAVHTPIQAKEEMAARYRDKPASNGQDNPAYAAMIESVDQGIGRILGKLIELGIDEQTVVVLFSDNGGHGPVTSMQPLRGAKGMLYEGGIREPMAVRWPGSIEAGSRSRVPVTMVDFFPTILDLAGVVPPAGLVPPAGAVRQGDWKLIEFFEDGRIELYNLADDISESRELSGSLPDKADYLHQLLRGWRISVGAPVPTELNPLYQEGEKPGQGEQG